MNLITFFKWGLANDGNGVVFICTVDQSYGSGGTEETPQLVIHSYYSTVDVPWSGPAFRHLQPFLHLLFSPDLFYLFFQSAAGVSPFIPS